MSLICRYAQSCPCNNMYKPHILLWGKEKTEGLRKCNEYAILWLDWRVMLRRRDESRLYWWGDKWENDIHLDVTIIKSSVEICQTGKDFNISFRLFPNASPFSRKYAEYFKEEKHYDGTFCDIGNNFVVTHYCSMCYKRQTFKSHKNDAQ